MSTVFVTGGTGYMGRALIPRLLARGHTVRALVRPGSQARLPAGCEAVVGDALDETTYAGQVAGADTLVHLVGVAHPSPAKAKQFRSIDLVAARAAIAAAVGARVGHFVYVSVAHPAPLMKEFIAVRTECEALLGGSGLNATILRPWYVLGPGHRWPYLLLPLYFVLERLPASRETARRVALVTLAQMIAALEAAVDQPASGQRIVDVAAIRGASRTAQERAVRRA